MYYLAYLFDNGFSHSTISCYISGLGFYCKINDMEDITQKFVVQTILEGIKRSRPKQKDMRLPITRELLKVILSSLTTVCKSSYEINLFKAAFSLAFHGLFRVGELTVSNGMCRHILLMSNLSIFNNHLKVDICSSKTDQYGKGTTMLIPSQIDQSICPFKLVNEYIKVRPLIQGPLFCHYDVSSLSRYQFVAVLKKALMRVNIPCNRFSSHSFRIGAATSLSMEGISDSEIMQLGRWRSYAYKGYIRI
jgi:hypothetical protein